MTIRRAGRFADLNRHVDDRALHPNVVVKMERDCSYASNAPPMISRQQAGPGRRDVRRNQVRIVRRPVDQTDLDRDCGLHWVAAPLPSGQMAVVDRVACACRQEVGNITIPEALIREEWEARHLPADDPPGEVNDID